MLDKEFFMKEALKEAKKAYKKEEVPVGAVIVKNRKNYCKSTQCKRNKEKRSRTCGNISNSKSL